MKHSTVVVKGAMWLAVPLFALVILGRFFTPAHIVHSSDAVIRGAGVTVDQTLKEVCANWRHLELLGHAGGAATGLPSFLRILVPGIWWNNWGYTIGCVLASLVFLCWFRARLSFWAAATGALIAFWLSSNYTLLYAGHTFKSYVVFFFMAFIASTDLRIRTRGWVLGAFAGLMFAQQPDVAMLFALFGGAYLLFRLWREKGAPVGWRKVGDWLKVLVPAAIVALLFAAGPLLSGYKHNVKQTAQVQTETPEERWHYITQWSMPPEEMIDFIAPNYTGIRSGEPDGPYWGRMGRTEGWEKHRQGFMNYRMESLYLGIIPIGFALFAVCIARWSNHRDEIIFWAVAALLALLLSFGKHFPLYALFYQLPVVNNIRNPNKFLQVFQIALAILTVYGVDGLFGYRQKTADGRRKTGDGRAQTVGKDDQIAERCFPASVLRWFFWAWVVVCGVLALTALVVTLDRTGEIARFAAKGWPRQAAQVIVANKIHALWHAVFMAAVLTLTFAVFVFRPFVKWLRFRSGIAAALVLIVAVDAVILSRDYVKEMPRSYIESNVLTSFLRENLGHERVALARQDGIYNIWLTFLLPYHRIPMFNFAAMPRMPIDLKRFLEAGYKDPVRMWRFSAVKYLLGPTTVQHQIPAGELRRVMRYQLGPAPGNNHFRVLPSENGDHAVFEMLRSVPRYALLADVQEETDEQTLARLADRHQPLLNGRLIADGVAVVAYRPGRVELKTRSDAPARLRVAERWDADWTATVDGNPAPVLRMDFLLQGVDVPAGEHHVILAYTPSKLFFYMQMLGYAVLLVALAAGLVMRRRGKSGETQRGSRC